MRLPTVWVGKRLGQNSYLATRYVYSRWKSGYIIGNGSLFRLLIDWLFHSLAVVNKYWAVFVPGVLGGVIFYAYSTPGYLGGIVRAVVDPILQPLLRFASHLIPGLLG